AEHAIAEPVALLQHLQHGAGLGVLCRLRQQRLVDVRVEGAVRLDLLEPVLARHLDERALDKPDALLELRRPTIFSARRRASLVGAAGSLLCRLERPLEVVEDREQLPEQRLVRARGHRLVLARRPLAEVVELGLQPLERVEVLVALLLERLHVRDRPLPRRASGAPVFRPGGAGFAGAASSPWGAFGAPVFRPGGAGFAGAASSLRGVCPCLTCDLRIGHQLVGASSSTTSASSITSSSEAASEAPLPPLAACAALALA